MPGIDPSLPFHPLGMAVLTISDTRTIETDVSGAVLTERLAAAGHVLMGRAIVPDDIDAIRGQLRSWQADPAIEIILTTGGTGFSPRDNTPEAVKPLLRREMDGFPVAFHQKSLQTVGVASMQSRAFAGQIGDAFIFCIPGSPGACRDAWDGLLELEFDSRHKPCSIAGALPRLREVCA
ncbi:molybdenum cofactor synthesis domain-containing protein [Novosphingobium sp.]|jgi:molybdenum cofactor biosynthesis protein B|uniref:molybdenum cofactor synthesis domain-containing protein n=1 Tax=Novosphingobium sp. TaxID=1874826 RepID=UPI001EC86FF5|nr:molybdenum cofactor synthesis domain-containing protein [Novosphingobium sp.]MBK6799962.1 molybdenum cofactor biosynthesis protein [Novosphingobium sp.]MBK9011024.1 molybdenum cofactor biosynthesis protein [Novosphingobium sp.]